MDIQQLIAALESDCRETQLNAIQQLAEMGNAACEALDALLLVILFSADAEVREAAKYLIWRIDPKVGGPVEMAEKMEQSGERWRAAENHARSLTLKEARRQIRSRFRAIEKRTASLATIKELLCEQTLDVMPIGIAFPDAISDLVELFRDEKSLRYQIGRVLTEIARHHQGRVFEALRPLAFSENTRLREAALYVLVTTGQCRPDVIEDCIAAFRDNPERNGWPWKALTLAGRCEPAAFVLRMKPLLEDEKTCQSASDLLSDALDALPLWMPEVEKLLDESDKRIREVAAQIIRRAKANVESCPEPSSTDTGDAEPEILHEDGIAVIRVLPSAPPNPSNSEGAFLSFMDGRIVFAHKLIAHDGERLRLTARDSHDGGMSWSKDRYLLPFAPPSTLAMNSVSLLRLADESIAVNYCVHYWADNAPGDERVYIRRSTDEGKTWAHPIQCTPSGARYRISHDRLIQLKSGRLLLPTADQSRRPRIRENALVSPFVGVPLCLFSDDGVVWHEGRNGMRANEYNEIEPECPGVVELKDGRILMFYNSGPGHQYQAISTDGGATWSAATPMPIGAPHSSVAIKRIPATGDLVMVWTDRSKRYEHYKGRGVRTLAQQARADAEPTPLMVAISRDEAETWGQVKPLPLGTHYGSYHSAITFVGDRMVLGHCAGDKRTEALSRTEFMAVDIEWLYR